MGGQLQSLQLQRQRHPPAMILWAIAVTMGNPNVRTRATLFQCVWTLVGVVMLTSRRTVHRRRPLLRPRLRQLHHHRLPLAVQTLRAKITAIMWSAATTVAQLGATAWHPVVAAMIHRHVDHLSTMHCILG